MNIVKNKSRHELKENMWANIEIVISYTPKKMLSICWFFYIYISIFLSISVVYFNRMYFHSFLSFVWNGVFTNTELFERIQRNIKKTQHFLTFIKSRCAYFIRCIYTYWHCSSFSCIEMTGRAYKTSECAHWRDRDNSMWLKLLFTIFTVHCMTYTQPSLN